MKKFRLTMLLAAALSVLAFVSTWGYFSYLVPTTIVPVISTYQKMTFVIPVIASFFVIIFSPATFTASMIMLLASLGRIHETVDGRLAYDPTNPYWRIMKWAWKESFKNSLTECKAMWLTSITVFLTMLITLIVFLFSFLAYQWLTGQLKPQNNLTWQQWTFYGGIFFILSLVLLTGIFEKKFKTNRVLEFIAQMVATGILLAILGTLSFITGSWWMSSYGFSLIEAIVLTPLTFVVVIAGIVGVVGGLIKTCELLTADNLLKRYILAFKDRTCLILFEDTPKPV